MACKHKRYFRPLGPSFFTRRLRCSLAALRGRRRCATAAATITAACGNSHDEQNYKA
jgi:hypothetical protein